MDNTIEDLINNVVDQDFSAASATFNDIIQSKMGDALEQEKIAVAGQIFNGDESDEEQLEMDFDDDDISDEDIEDAIEDTDEDDDEDDEE